MKNTVRFYIGSYTKPELDGIYCYEICDNTLDYKKVCSIKGIFDPSYLCIDKENRKLYSVMESMLYKGEFGGAVVSYDIDENQIRKISSKGTKGSLPCHILLDKENGYIFASNYWSGSVSMFKLNNTNDIEELCDFVQHEGHGPNEERQEGPHVHFIGFSMDKKGIWSVDLGIDAVKYYEIDLQHDKIIPHTEKDVHLPKGEGPRHFVLGKNNSNLMYIVCELSSKIYVVNNVDNSIVQKISTLPDEVTNSTCAAIKMSENGKYLYVSNRGHDSIAVFEIKEDGLLSLIQIEKTVGKNPRDFSIYKKMLLIANQDTNSVNIFHVDENTGFIKNSGTYIECKSPVCIVI